LKSVLKWVGSKSRIIPTMVEYIDLTGVRRIYEPFCGSCSFTLYIEPPFAVLGDVNPYLIYFWNQLQRDWRSLYEEFLVLKEKHSKEFFLKVRDAFNRHDYSMGAAAMFLYFNKAAYNGIWRINRKGELNSPCGNYKKIYGVDPVKMEKLSKVIDKYCFFNCEYGELLQAFENDDMLDPSSLIYLDPPYDQRYVQYNSSPFMAREQVRLAMEFKRLKKMGARIVMTNSDTPLIRKLYENEKIIEIEEYRCISQKVESRGYKKQLLIM